MMEKSKRFIRIAVSVLIVLICTLLCTVCLYHNLAKKLPPDLKFYYDVYSPLMKSKVPDWIDANDRTEGQHFLKMPAHIQNAYIYEYFWKIRRPGLEEVFFSRLNYAGIHFGRLNPWQSYRGRVFLLLGPPMMIHYYRNGMETIESGVPESGDTMVWYYYERGLQASYWFYFVPPDDWRLSLSGIRSMGNQQLLERSARESFAPTKEGWITYGEYLYDALEEK